MGEKRLYTSDRRAKVRAIDMGRRTGDKTLRAKAFEEWKAAQPTRPMSNGGTTPVGGEIGVPKIKTPYSGATPQRSDKYFTMPPERVRAGATGGDMIKSAPKPRGGTPKNILTEVGGKLDVVKYPGSVRSTSVKIGAPAAREYLGKKVATAGAAEAAGGFGKLAKLASYGRSAARYVAPAVSTVKEFAHGPGIDLMTGASILAEGVLGISKAKREEADAKLGTKLIKSGMKYSKLNKELGKTSREGVPGGIKVN